MKHSVDKLSVFSALKHQEINKQKQKQQPIVYAHKIN